MISMDERDEMHNAPLEAIKRTDELLDNTDEYDCIAKLIIESVDQIIFTLTQPSKVDDWDRARVTNELTDIWLNISEGKEMFYDRNPEVGGICE